MVTKKPMTKYRTCAIDASFTSRAAYEANGVTAMFGSAVALYTRMVQYAGQVVWCWEARGAEKGAFRQRISPDYKARRSPPAQEYLDACEELQQHLPLLGAWQAWSSAEADDVAYTISVEWPGPILLYSVDKDWCQFIRPGVHLLRRDTSRRPRGIAPEEWRRPADKLITSENIEEVTGFTADGWFEVLCLAGDTTDCIPGLPRVGDARARAIHTAVPRLVDELLAAAGPEGPVPDAAASRARALCAASAPEQLQWVEVAIQNIESLRTTAALVRPYRVELHLEPPAEDGLEEFRAWLEGHGLDSMFESVARLVPDTGDWAAPPAQVLTDEELPF